MYGYITLNQPEIRFRDFYHFRSYYCGLCNSLKKNYGQASRFALGYDMTFLVLLLSGLYDTETETKQFRCMLHPFRKRTMRENVFSKYCAAMDILLAYYKCMDDWRDERKLSRLLYAWVIRCRVNRAKAQWPEKAAQIASSLRRLRQLEKKNSQDLDAVSGCFGEVLGTIFACREDHWAEALYRMGFFIGKYIYLMDAYEDVFEDEKKGCYNPFLCVCRDADFDRNTEKILEMMIAEAASVFEKLPIVDHAEILRNILYSGVWCAFERVSKSRKQDAKAAVQGSEEEEMQYLEKQGEKNDGSI